METVRYFIGNFLLCIADIAVNDDSELFARVAVHRRKVFGRSGVDYDTIRRGSLDMIPSEEQLPAWQKDYDGMRDVMFFDRPPAFEVLLERVRTFQDEFNSEPDSVPA